jgi:hypothetical protein
MKDRDAYWEQKVLVANLQAQLEERQRKVDQLQLQKQAWQEAKSEHEVTKSKLVHLQEKLARYEERTKSRVLADCTADHLRNSNISSSSSSSNTVKASSSAKEGAVNKLSVAVTSSAADGAVVKPLVAQQQQQQQQSSRIAAGGENDRKLFDSVSAKHAIKGLSAGSANVLHRTVMQAAVHVPVDDI